MPRNRSDKWQEENPHSASSGFVPSEAMLRQARKSRERMINTSGGSGGSGPGSLKERRRSNGASTSKSKGKTYKTRSEREPKEISEEEYFIRNKIRDTKNGSRNPRSATKFRDYSRVGSDVFKTPRSDRIGNAADSDEEENTWLKSNYPKTDKYGVPIRSNRQTKEWNPS